MMTLDDLVKLTEILGGEEKYFELSLNEDKRKELDDLIKSGDGVDFIDDCKPKTIGLRFLHEK